MAPPVKTQRLTFEQRMRQTLALSERHRRWGWNCPALDIDFLVVEYDAARPVALIEYKGIAPGIETGHPSIRAIRNLADDAKLPFFVVRYDPQDWTKWMPQPANGRAREVLPECEQMTERQYVELLYRLRGRAVRDEISDMLEQEF